VTIAKMFTSITMFMAFEISITVIALVNNGIVIPGGGYTASVGKIFLTVGCLLGGYSIANWIGTQYGDTNGLGESMRDIGLIKTATGATMAMGALALKTGTAGLKTGNAMTGGKALQGLQTAGNSLHNMTGNVARSSS
jgi:hypothetical protein